MKRRTVRVISPLRLLIAILLLAGNVSAQQPSDTRPSSNVTFDFQDADLRLVLTALARAGGVSIVYGSLPERTVTLRTNGPVPRSAVRRLMESLASANDLVLVEENGLILIEAVAEPVVDQNAASTTPSELRLFVYRLKHARAVRLAGTLQALFGGASVGTGNGLSRSGLSAELRDVRLPPGIPEEGPPSVSRRSAARSPARSRSYLMS